MYFHTASQTSTDNITQQLEHLKVPYLRLLRTFTINICFCVSFVPCTKNKLTERTLCVYL